MAKNEHEKQGDCTEDTKNSVISVYFCVFRVPHVDPSLLSNRSNASAQNSLEMRGIMRFEQAGFARQMEIPQA